MGRTTMAGLEDVPQANNERIAETLVRARQRMGKSNADMSRETGMTAHFVD
jgi:hypothetical protein